MKLETERLYIQPLNSDQLNSYTLTDSSLTNSLQLSHQTRNISDHVLSVIKEKILPVIKDESKNYLFYTFWTVIHKQLKVMVADICFKGEPNEQGEVEIGYGTYTEFEGKGYMSEAVGAISKWALNQTGAKAVIAETDINNIGSQKVLEKNGYVKYKQTEENYYWKLEK